MYFAGIDSGSTTTKFTVIDESKNIIFFDLIRTGFEPEEKINILTERFLRKFKVKQNKIASTIATGYGGKRFEQYDFVTEITCHARGTHYLFPEIRHIVDVGGQDSKAIIKNKKGKVVDFILNDKCAAGTGRFLEVMATVFDIEPEGFNELVKLDANMTSGKKNAEITSFCTVFAESEVISLLSKHISREKVAYAVCHSVAEKIINFSFALFGEMPDIFVFSGGTAKIKPVVAFVKEISGANVKTVKRPQITAALGAALIARESYHE